MGKATYRTIRSQVPTLDRDRYMADDIELMADSIRGGALLTPAAESGLDLC